VISETPPPYEGAYWIERDDSAGDGDFGGEQMAGAARRRIERDRALQTLHKD